MVSDETGKSRKDASGESAAAAAVGLFFAGEGQRMYGRTTTSSVAGRRAMTIRQPIGVAGLIVPANTPIANVAWKVFPALVCGNTVVLKSAEDTPGTAALFAEMAAQSGLPSGVVNVVHGLGAEAGAPLVEHPDVGVISFTGSTAVGREIQRVAGSRLARVSLELGGKNPFVVCDDADLDGAVRWAVLSAFSNAGQRCASGSRIIVFSAVAEEFRNRLVAATRLLHVGSGDEDDFGPVINERQMQAILRAVEQARRDGARILTGGHRATTGALADGFYIEPTLVDGLDHKHPVSQAELFGPVAALYTVSGFGEALALANDSPLRAHCVHSHAQHRPRPRVRGAGGGRRRRGECRHLRQRAAHAVWRGQAVGQWHTRAGHRSTRRVFVPEGHLPEHRRQPAVKEIRAVALVPARSGSKRVAHKNVTPLAGHPLLAYTIAAARGSGVFDTVVVSTDSERYAAIARHYGAEVPSLRPAALAGDASPDIEWVEHTLEALEGSKREFDAFSILRPTSPFRLAATIRRAWAAFVRDPGADSLRAVELCQQHPAKMWVKRGNRLLPLLPFGPESQPWHSSQYPSLPVVYVQNASLEIAWTRALRASRTIAGVNILPFLTEGFEGFDVNHPYDWQLAELLVARGEAVLPEVTEPPYVPDPEVDHRS